MSILINGHFALLNLKWDAGGYQFVYVWDPHHMLKPYSKFEDFMLKSFKVINSITSHFSLVLVQCCSPLAQAVMSQTENHEHLHRVWLIKYVSQKCFSLIFVKDRQQSAQRDLHFWSYLRDYVMYINLLYVKK